MSTKSAWRISARELFLGGLPLRTFLVRLWRSINQDEIIDRAAELAYYFLFALFPALLLLSVMFGWVAAASNEANLKLMFYLARVIPSSAFAIVQTTFTETTKTDKAGHIAFGGLTALWAATYGMSSAQTVLNVIYHSRETRPYWKAKAVATLLTIIIFILVFSAMLLLVLGDFLAKLLISDLIANPLILRFWRVAKFFASLFLMCMMFALTYHWGPDRKGHPWRWFSPGAFLGVLGWLAASLGFRFYLRVYNPYASVYGSLGAVIVLLVWFYVTGFMLLLGAEVNAIIERAATEPDSTPP